MKLTDMKKLKVAELRSRLREAGLDSRGLKAELVDRLWAAAERGPSPGEVQLQHDRSPTEAAEVRAPSSETGVAALPCCPHSTRDTATQTEPEAGGTAPRRGSEVVPESLRGNEVDDPGEHSRALSCEGTGRGRAFYEFKEEMRYKRLTHGVLRGRVGFEVRLERKLMTTQLVKEEDTEPHGVRVGWSVAGTSLLLGEDELSFAYDGRSKKVSGGKEEEFGEPLSEGDIIGCYAVLLMVGLPGSGKSHWAMTHMKQHPEKQYKLLGTEELLACMICNILFSARRHKLRLFTGFRRRVVVVFPAADEWKRRLTLHQTSDGEQIPETALLKLQGWNDPRLNMQPWSQHPRYWNLAHPDPSYNYNRHFGYIGYEDNC
ncbi:hypothetical protein F2P81_008059 [Scophthalmus maximus]|uniref:SAP domain-containing protein n=1 Tax=Scophthalmus maximus TaxID=52904 RepID=A0A6A4T9H6_SCOMX|nr:hypothetical protein F2P81_008059 [Scophthalmus maximus]